MKILHLTTHLNRGGISIYILTVGAGLRAKGHEIFVVSAGGEMEQEFQESGLHVKNFEIQTKSELSPKIYRALPHLVRWIKEEKIELIHAHTRVTQVAAFWIHCLTGIPFVTTAHGFYKRRLGRRILPAWGERVIAISDAVGTDLRELHRVPLDRVKVIYNGLDLQGLLHRFSSYNPVTVRNEYGIPLDSPVVGVTARLVPDKGHEYLIRAVKALESDIFNLKLLIVGDGRYRNELEILVRRLELENRVVFTGNIQDVSKPLAAMDVFVLPAVWREGFGLSIAEAMTCQKPVIVTNIWALNTLIQDRANGVLVEPRNVEQLADAIRFMLKNRDFRETIGKTGQKTAQERFSLDRMVHELESVYEEVLNRYNTLHGCPINR